MATATDMISSQQMGAYYDKNIYKVILIVLPIVILLAFVALNYTQLAILALTRIEKARLEQLARTASWEGFTNPVPMQDGFDDSAPSSFWRDMFIIGGGEHRASTNFWHASGYEITNGQLTLYTYPDPAFATEVGSNRNHDIVFLGAAGFMPTPTEDVVVEWKMITSDNFVGSTGLAIEPEGMHDGPKVAEGKKYDIIALSILAPETNALYGTTGALCMVAFDRAPFSVVPIPDLDFTEWHDYKLRMSWVDQITWKITVSVDGMERCSMLLPPLGKTELEIWSDNHMIRSLPKMWYQIEQGLDIGYQNSEEVWSRFDDIRIYAEKK